MQERVLWLLVAVAGLVLLATAAGKHLGQHPDDSTALENADLPGPVRPSTPSLSDPIRVEVLNGCGAPNVAAQWTRRARDLGLDVINEGNAESFSFPESMVIDRRGDMGRARKAASILGISSCIQQISGGPAHLAEVSVVIGRDHRRLQLLDLVRQSDQGKER